MYRKSMREALREAREYRDPVKEDRGFSSQQIKMAYGVLNDPRYKGGNYSGAFKAIEKIAKGLASHPDVANALKRANEELDLKEARWHIEGTLSYRGIRNEDSFDMVIDAPTESAAEDKAYKELDKARAKRKIGPGGGGSIENVEIHQIERTNDRLQGPETFSMGNSFDPRLKEANMKRILGALQDKLSKEGGAAGFDDLKKTAKSMGLNLTPAMLKDMPGIKQHRDGDYILEASKYLRYSDLLIQKGRMQRAGDKQGEKQTDIEIEKEKKKLNITDEFKLEEKFTKKDFDKNEDENDHTLNAVMLAKEFGSSKEIKDMEDIDKRHRQRGHINEPDYSKRNAIVKKYYPRLK